MENSSAEQPAMTGPMLRTRRGTIYQLPMFLPVYQPRSAVFQLAAWQNDPPIEGIIVNAYFLFKQRELRKSLAETSSLKAFVGFNNLIATDSGAFQGFTRKLYLSNKDIVRFQDAIGSDIVSPLDLVTPPGDRRTIAEAKLEATEKRIAEGLRLVERGTLAAVQQGGKFLDLRHRSICRLMEMGAEYIAIGSLVPFFTTNHDMSFPAAVLSDARREAGPSVPIHVYGAGDPCELPFMAACGATIFDSSSYGHYADGKWYMTPYGALSDAGPILAGEFKCLCTVCRESAIEQVFADRTFLARHNLFTICDTVAKLRPMVSDPGKLESHLQHILQVHSKWFPKSRLAESWAQYRARS